MHEGHEGLPPEVERIGRATLDAAFRVHGTLGPGLLEHVYEQCLAEELRTAGLHVQQQLALPVTYGNVTLEVGLRLDLLVQNEVVVEVKAVDALASVHVAQTLTYLRFANRRLGYVINFNTALLKHGIRRVVL